MSRPTNSVIEQEEALQKEGLLSCRKCLEVKPISSFGSDRRSRNGLQVWCKPCVNERNRRLVAANPVSKEKKAEYQRRYREKNGTPDPAHTRRKNLWRLYKIAPEDYDRMLAEQDGVCAICGSDDPQVGRHVRGYFHVDHCHGTGKVRGLLCGKCNWGLGLLGDSISGLEKALEYLRIASDG